MKARFILPVLLCGALCTAVPLQASPPLTASAAESSQVYGLILKCTLGLSRNDCGEIVVTVKTQASGLMSEVGFRDLVLQRSKDGSEWEDVRELGSSSGRNVRYFIADDLIAPAEEGYYYRAVCTHYVTSTVTDTKTQTVGNSSRPLWISKSSVPSDGSKDTLPADDSKTVDEVITTTAAPKVTSAADKVRTTGTVTTVAGKTTTAAAKSAAGTDSPATGDELPAGAAIMLAAAAAASLAAKKRRDD